MARLSRLSTKIVYLQMVTRLSTKLAQCGADLLMLLTMFLLGILLTVMLELSCYSVIVFCLYELNEFC